ncbi:hypothetical protein Trydic_g15834 [Trypoxylus dichotomus]
MAMSKSFVAKWAEQLKIRSVDDLPERGSIGKVTPNTEKNCRGIKVPHTTIRSTVKKPVLGEIHVTKRLAWAKENLDRDWSNVIFTNEASVWVLLPSDVPGQL